MASILICLTLLMVTLSEPELESKVFRTIGCRAGERLSSPKGRQGSLDEDKRRLVSIGDVHGSLIGLHELLFKAGLTAERNSCDWHPDTKANGGVILVQNGDIVDRGPNASEAWLCLKHLQDTASAHDSEVIRLLGNHELWWLTGQLSYRNKKNDTKEKVEALVTLMKEEILSGAVKGAHSMVKDGLPLIFVHAGLRPDMISKLHETVPALKNPSDKRGESVVIAEYINKKLLSDLESCGGGMAKCKLDDVLYSAGPERGGNRLGGPFWTDFSVLEEAHRTQVEHGDALTDWVQIVGHTVEVNEIRATRGLGAVCTDAGMMYGGRAFLEVVDGRFISYEKEETKRNVAASALDAKWYRRDLTAHACEMMF